MTRSPKSAQTPRILTVKNAWYLTPNMIRVVFAGPELDGFPEGREGGNCKLLIPNVINQKTRSLSACEAASPS